MRALFYLTKRTLINRVKKAVRRPATYLYLALAVFYIVSILVAFGSLAVAGGIAYREGIVYVMTVWDLLSVLRQLSVLREAKRRDLPSRTRPFCLYGACQLQAGAAPRSLPQLPDGALRQPAFFRGGCCDLPCGTAPGGAPLCVQFRDGDGVGDEPDGLPVFRGGEVPGADPAPAPCDLCHGGRGPCCDRLVFHEPGHQRGRCGGFLPLAGAEASAGGRLGSLGGEPSRDGPDPWNVTGTVLFVLACGGLCLVAAKIRCTGAYYEDAAKFADDYAEIRRRSRKGENTIGFGRKKLKKVSLSGWGSGARAIFSRQMLEYKKERFFIFTGFTLAALVGAVVCIAFVGGRRNSRPGWS